MLIIIIVNTKNLMFNSVLVSSLEFFKDGYHTQNMETGNSEWRIVIWFSALVCAAWMELYELMVNIYTGKGPAQVALKRSAPRYKRDRNLLSYDPLPDQSVDVTANKHVTMIKSKILRDDL